jgi:hypothetical protein
MRGFFVLLTQMTVTLTVTGVWAMCSIQAGKMAEVDLQILGMLALAWGLSWPFPSGGSK